jgi:hypothetical protein
MRDGAGILVSDLSVLVEVGGRPPMYKTQGVFVAVLGFETDGAG